MQKMRRMKGNKGFNSLFFTEICVLLKHFHAKFGSSLSVDKWTYYYKQTCILQVEWKGCSAVVGRGCSVGVEVAV